MQDKMLFREADPVSHGFDAARLEKAVHMALAAEVDWPRNLASARELPGLTQMEPAPWNELIGPLMDRQGPSGMIFHDSHLIAQWGDVDSIEMTFSIAKSYLAVITGLALADGLLQDIDEKVSERLAIEEFSSGQNRKITWRHLLTLSSEWEGTLFSKPDQVDHYRTLGDEKSAHAKGTARPLGEPGSYWEYNDVRVNALSLALLHLIGEPLPAYLKRKVMDPIGTSDSWSWQGYRNAVVKVRGKEMVSVPGGTHWGGGLWISTRDHARFALLLANGGKWGETQLIPADWIEAMWRPCALNSGYGLLWWLNGAHEMSRELSPATVCAVGAGGHVIAIDRENKLVIVMRWVNPEKRPAILDAVLAARR